MLNPYRESLSILDTDLYKLTQQQAVLALYPEAEATYQFVDRRKDKLGWLSKILVGQMEEFMSSFCLSDKEAEWLQKNCSYFTPWYIEYLRNYRFDMSEIFTLNSDDNGDLQITIKGPWHKTILWEVPLMALISELYFCSERHAHKWTRDGQQELAKSKCETLKAIGCKFADFGTRRRRDFYTQDTVVRTFCDCKYNGFMGTSNVFLAKMYNTNPIGTLAHEWIQAHSVLCSLRHANRYSLQSWRKVYGGKLGVALTDTYGTDAFLRDFDDDLSSSFYGVRQDSGNPTEFAIKMVEHYKSKGIDPSTKTIVFSDALTTDSVAPIQETCNNLGINCCFGIGTHFTNDFEGALKPLNMVIKLTGLNGCPVVKLSDDLRKEIGDADALRVAKWTFFDTPLH